MDRSRYEKMSVVEKIDIIRKIYINTPTTRKIDNIIDYCHKQSQLDGEPYCCAVLGPLGSGKTVLLERHLQKYPKSEGENGMIVKGVYCVIPARPTLKSVTESTALGIGEPILSGGATQITDRIINRYVPGCQIEIFFFDELQHMNNSLYRNDLKDSTDWYKNLAKKTKRPLIFAGIQKGVEDYLQSNAQLKSLFIKCPPLKNYQWNPKSSKSLRDFQKFLHRFDKQLPLQEESNISNAETARRIYLATGGVTRSITRLLRTAARIAIESKEEKISAKILMRTFKQIGGHDENFNQVKNPFINM